MNMSHSNNKFRSRLSDESIAQRIFKSREKKSLWRLLGLQQFMGLQSCQCALITLKWLEFNVRLELKNPSQLA